MDYLGVLFEREKKWPDIILIDGLSNAKRILLVKQVTFFYLAF